MDKINIAIIGGGASGIMAAIQGAMAGAKITIYEKNDRIGKKLLATGNGKCNFTNLTLNESCYNSSDIKKVMEFIRQFDEKSSKSFFESLGMLVKDKNGYLYPASEQASTVLDILRLKLLSLGVQIITECKVTKIEKNKQELFSITADIGGQKTEYQADRVILSIGSRAGVQKGTYQDVNSLLQSFNFPHITQVPGLVPLRVSQDYMKSVAGVRMEGEITLYIDQKEVQKERGEIQLTDYGVSGIPTFQLSRFAAFALAEKKKVKISINTLPDFTVDELQQYMNQRELWYREETAEEFLLGIANKKINQLFLKLAGLHPQDQMIRISKEKKNQLFNFYHHWELVVHSTNPIELAQICAGGIPVQLIGEGMETKTIKGLYITGEILDVDGRCGGYNLQWAFTSGYLAGRHAALSGGREEYNS